MARQNGMTLKAMMQKISKQGTSKCVSFKQVVRVLLVVCFVALAGCSSGPGFHKQAVNQANHRWRDARSKLYLQMAQRQFDTGDLKEAEKTLLQAMVRDSKNGRIYLLAGRIALEQGFLERASHQFELASQFKPELPEPYYYQGIVQQRWQQYTLACEQYLHAYEKQPDEVSYLLAYSEMLVAMKQDAQAVSLLESKLAYFDQNAGMRLALAQLYGMQNKDEKAIVFYQDAIRLAPQDLTIVESYVGLLITMKKYGQAADILKRLCQQSSYRNRNDMYQLLGKMYQATDQLKEARRVFSHLRDKKPDDVKWWIKLAEIAWAQNDLPATLSAASRVMALSPRRYEGYLLGGMVWQKRKQMDLALSLFNQATKVAPREIGPWVLRGIVLQQTGQREAALQAYRKVLQRDPKQAEVQRLLASVVEK